SGRDATAARRYFRVPSGGDAFLRLVEKRAHHFGCLLDEGSCCLHCLLRGFDGDVTHLLGVREGDRNGCGCLRRPSPTAIEQQAEERADGGAARHRRDHRRRFLLAAAALHLCDTGTYGTAQEGTDQEFLHAATVPPRGECTSGQLR